MKTTVLYEIAAQNDIDIEYGKLSGEASLAVMYDSNAYAICLNAEKMKTSSEERTHLAHELGHCMTGSFYNRYSSCDILEKHEYRANRWAAENMIPWPELLQAFQNGVVECWELAEYFDVTEGLVHKAFDTYTRRGLLPILQDDELDL